MKRKIFTFCLILCVLLLNPCTAFANDDGLSYHINIYQNDKFFADETRDVVEGESIQLYDDCGEFIKGTVTINGKKGVFFWFSGDTHFTPLTANYSYPTAGDNVEVNLYYKIEESEPEPEPEPTYGTITLNISDGHNPVEGYSVTFTGKKNHQTDTFTRASNSEGQIIVELDESYEWEYTANGSTYPVGFGDNHSYSNDISLLTEWEPEEIEYDEQDYNINVTLQFNEEAGGTLVDGLTDSTDIIEKSFVKKSGTAITYEEIINDLEKEDELVVHNDKLYRSSSVYVGAKDSVNTENTLVNHGEYIVTNANTTITIQFIYVKDVELDEPTPEPEPEPSDEPTPEPEPGPGDEPVLTDEPELEDVSEDTPKDTPKDTSSDEPRKSIPFKAKKVKQTPVTIVETYTTEVYESYEEYETLPVEKKEEIKEISEETTPLGAGHETQKYWALINLIATLLTLILSLILLFRFLIKHNKGLKVIIGLIVAIVSIIVFILTENMLYPMILVDKWTLLMIIFLVINILLFIKRRDKDEEEEEDEITE